jgi:type II secretory pathway component PulC
VLRRVLLVADAVLLGVALLLGIRLYQTAVASVRPAAPPSAVVAEPPAAAAEPAAVPPAPPAFSAYTLIAERNLFSPTRTETPPEPPRSAAATPAAPPAPRPRLHGVVLLPDGRARAYLEDVQQRKVFAYSVGDAVSGSRVDQIRPDRVVLRRGGEVFEVLLRDPSKPRAVPVAQGGPGVTPPIGPPRPARAAAGAVPPPQVTPPAFPAVPVAPPPPLAVPGDAATDESESQ